MKSPIIYMLKWQAIILVLLTLGSLIFGVIAAYSIALGACIYIAANAYFSFYAFRYQGDHMGPWITRSFSWGESGKLALAAMGFALTFRLVRPLDVTFLFIGFSSMIILQWFVARRIIDAMTRQQAALNELDKAK